MSWRLRIQSCAVNLCMWAGMRGRGLKHPIHRIEESVQNLPKGSEDREPASVRRQDFIRLLFVQSPISVWPAPVCWASGQCVGRYDALRTMHKRKSRWNRGGTFSASSVALGITRYPDQTKCPWLARYPSITDPSVSPGSRDECLQVVNGKRP
jgi:hypothetical protein